MKLFSQILSVIYFPLFIPIYAMLLLINTDFISYYPREYIFCTTFWSLTLCTATPMCIILLLKLTGLISEMALRNKKERFIPFAVTGIAFFFTSFVFYYNAFPPFLCGLSIASSIALFVNTAITKFWRISAHLTGVSALLGGTLVTCFHFHIFPFVIISLLILSCGLVCMARLYLKAHTPAQCLAGFANGFGLTLLSSFFNWDFIMRHICQIFS